MKVKMAANLHVLKAKSAWKKIEIPTGGEFADLIEFQELSDYELIRGCKTASAELSNRQISGKKRKRRRSETTDCDHEEPLGDDENIQGIASEGQQSSRQKKKKKKIGGAQKQITSAILAKDSQDQVEDSVLDGMKTQKSNRKRKRKKKHGEAADSDVKEAVSTGLVSKALSDHEEGSVQEQKSKKRKKNKKNGAVIVVSGRDQAVSAATATAAMEDEPGMAASVQESQDEDMESWKGMGLSPVLLQALKEEGFKEPTAIQAQAVPHAILHRLNIIGAAQTGSGKTLAFGLPILEHILRNPRSIEARKKGPQALVLLPTRELALQVRKHLKAAARHTDIQVVTVVGGMAAQKQIRLLKRHPHIVVATPGRLWELIEEGDPFLQNLHTVEQFVLDEADRMIEKGHFEELHKIIGLLTSHAGVKRQHYIFSATLTVDHAAPAKKKRKKDIKDAKQKLEELVQELGIEDKPKVIDLTRKEVTVDTLTETRISCAHNEKDLYLYYILRKYGGRTLVFCNSKDCIRRLVSVFTLLQRNPLPLHSDMHQKQRLKNLDRFAERETSVLLASDVAARGLDIKGVDHVVHYQVPFTVENYIHRSGRTARACREGVSVVLVCPDEITMYRNILKIKHGQDLPQFPVEWEVLRPLKAHVDMARKIDTEEHRLKKEEVNSNWMKKAAAEMDIELDDDLLPEEDNNVRERQHLKHRLKQQKLQLAQLLKQPLLPAIFSGRYPTKAGHLVMPKTFTRGNAVKDCSKRPKEQ